MISLLLKFLVVMLPVAAQAHHPMGGETPQTALQGLLSGFGHPIIELDHFLFIVGFALLLALCSRHLIVHIGLFLVAAMAGTGLRQLHPELPYLETGVLLSTVAAGVLLIVQKLDRAALIGVLAPAAGLFHGYGYGAAVLGAEETPLVAYLTGFSLIQATLMVILICATRLLIASRPQQRVNAYRMASGATVIGLAFLV